MSDQNVALEDNAYRPTFFGKLRIRTKLLLGFMAIIALTFFVVAITAFVLRYTNNAVDEVVNIQSKKAYLSYNAELLTAAAAREGSNFRSKFMTIGIAPAKELYLEKFLAYCGQLYSTLETLMGMERFETEKALTRDASNALSEFTSTFFSTINSIDVLYDPESGEYAKMNNDVTAFQEWLSKAKAPDVESAFYQMYNSYLDYRRIPDHAHANAVHSSILEFSKTLKKSSLSAVSQKVLKKYLTSFSDWFSKALEKEKKLAGLVRNYENAAARIIQAMKTSRQASNKNVDAQILALNKTEKRVQYGVAGLGGFTLIIGIILALLLSRGLTRQIGHIMTLLGELGIGNFAARTQIVTADELGEMSEALNAMLDSMVVMIQSQEERDQTQNAIIKLMGEIDDLTRGDLTVRAEVTEDITGAIADAFNTMAEQFSGIVKQVKGATTYVDKNASDVSKLTISLAEQSIRQNTQVNKTIKSVQEIVKSINTVSKNAAQSTKVSFVSQQNAKEGAEAVRKTNEAMDEIREQINETARAIKRLGESSMEIGNIVEIIDGIADRTSILALNASIQAATAGDAGHGFAIVAEEVQRLAESSGKSTRQIETLIKSIQAEIKDASTRMDESISKVVHGAQLADGAYVKLEEIETISNTLAAQVKRITDAATQQVQMSEKVMKDMLVVGKVSKDGAVSSKETARRMELLSKTSESLKNAVDIFKIKDQAVNAEA
ncbi:MAG: hypothetical protein CSA29_02930 [Desulfobacterales bacterium]|nr:MAG: hypothetical protein CSA29_02930 [Desulfobacterales bacterium]